MSGRLLVMTGTGTGIGKTHLSEVLLRHWRAAGQRVLGLKPIESGVGPDVVTDAARLKEASSFHVKPFGHALPDPVSPHLAARRTNTSFDLHAIAAHVHAVRIDCDVALVELPGGLFSPLSDRHLNIDFARILGASAILLCAPDRLGVLHDVLATARAAASTSLRLTGVVLIAPSAPDPSTGTNEDELRRFVSEPVLGTLPRGQVDLLVRHPDVLPLLSRISP